MSDDSVQFRSDGVGLSPAAYARLLAEIAETRGIAEDDIRATASSASWKPAWRKCSARMQPCSCRAAPLPTPRAPPARREAAAGSGAARKPPLQRRGRCAPGVSGLTLVPLAPGRATFTDGGSRTASPARRRRGSRSQSARCRSRRRCAGCGRGVRLRADAPLADFARGRGIGLHLDGARLLIDGLYRHLSGRIRRAVGSVYVSLYKYLKPPPVRSSPGPLTLLDGLYHSGACSAAASRMSGPMRRWHCTFSTASQIALAGPPPLPTVFGALPRPAWLPIDAPARATNVTFLPVRVRHGGSGGAGAARRRAASRSGRPGGRPTGRSSHCTSTRRSCAARSIGSSPVSPPHSPVD